MDHHEVVGVSCDDDEWMIIGDDYQLQGMDVKDAKVLHEQVLSTCSPLLLDVAAFVLLPRLIIVEHYLIVDYPSFEIGKLGLLIVIIGMVLDGMKKLAAIDGEDEDDDQMLMMEVTFGDSGGVGGRNRDNSHRPDDVLDDGGCYPDDYHEPGGHDLLTFHRNDHHCYDRRHFAGDLTAETVAVPLHWIGFDQVVFDDPSLVDDAPSLQSDDLEPRPTLVPCALPLVTCVRLVGDLA